MTEYRVTFFFCDGTKSASTMTLGAELLREKLGHQWITITPSAGHEHDPAMTLNLEHVYKIEYVPV